MCSHLLEPGQKKYQTGRHFFMAQTLANQGDLEKQGDGVDQRANGNTDLEGGSAVTDFCGARLDGGLELHIDYPSLKLNIAPENGGFQ